MTDQRILYTEEMVGANHPAKTDTLNRLALVEHDTEGKHTKGLGEIWTDVRAYGAVGDGATDDAAAINAAITAAKGTVYFPSGIYAIGSTITLKSGTEYYAPRGGTVFGSGAPGEHPRTGYGAALKWIGASGTMVTSFNLQSIVWDGIDLDDPAHYANGVIGISHTSDNTVTSQRAVFQNFRATNLGKAMLIGANSGGTHYQTDQVTIRNFHFYLVAYGLYVDSQNALQGSVIEKGNITPYTCGIHLENCGGVLSINSVVYGAAQNAPAAPGGAFIYIKNPGPGLTINNMQGETAAFTGWRDILWEDAPITSPVGITNSVVNRGWVTQGTGLQRIVSHHNYFNVAENPPGTYQAVALTGAKELLSIGDTFNTSNVVVETGTNNLVTYISPYFVGGDTNTVSYKRTYNAVVQEKKYYNGIRTGAATPAGAVTPDFVGEMYLDTTAHKIYVADGLTNANWNALN